MPSSTSSTAPRCTRLPEPGSGLRLHNTQSWVEIESPELASRLATLLDESTRPGHAFRLVLQDHRPGALAIERITEERGQEIRHDYDPKAGRWVVFWRSVLSILLPEHML